MFPATPSPRSATSRSSATRSITGCRSPPCRPPGQTATTGSGAQGAGPGRRRRSPSASPRRRRPRPSRPRASRSRRDAQLKGQCQQEYNALRDQVLEFLIRGNWIEQETKKQNLKVSDKDVQKQIDAAVKQAFQNPATSRSSSQRSGLTQADVFYQQRNQLLQQKLTEKVTKAQGNVTDAQIQQYYDKNKSKFATPERRDLRIVLTKTQAKAAQARKALESGQSWSASRRSTRSTRPPRRQGGKLAGVAKGQQEKALDDAIFKADKGKLVGPVKTQFGYYVLEVSKITRGQAAVARAVEGVDQADPHERQPAQGARHSSARTTASRWKAETALPQGLHDGRLQERPEDAADHVDRGGAAADDHRHHGTHDRQP